MVEFWQSFYHFKHHRFESAGEIRFPVYILSRFNSTVVGAPEAGAAHHVD
jgi:hypothetical protein